MKEKLIVIVDDDPDMIKMASLNLEREGFRVKGFSGSEDLFKFLGKERPDLIILDILLPEINGFDICKNLKRQARFSSIPIIILSAKDMETDKISGLDLGSDDYVTKPCSFDELRARIRAVLRRREAGASKIDIGGIVKINREKYEVVVKGRKLELTTTEFKILDLLSSKKGHVFSRNRILEYLWGEDKIVVDRTIDVHIRHLREKLGEAGRFIKNIRGIGYKLEEDTKACPVS